MSSAAGGVEPPEPDAEEVPIDGSDRVAVASAAHPRRLRELMLVLESVRIPYDVEEAPDGTAHIVVAASQAARARDNLEAFERENRGWPPPAETLMDLAQHPGDVVGYACGMIVLFVLSHGRLFELDWIARGGAATRAIRAGEWWRCVTALTLHADPVHLVGNLLFGSLFGLILCNLVGRGVAWLCFLLSGALGYALRAAGSDLEHRVIGASVGVFGLLGTIVVFQALEARRRRFGRINRLAPLVMGGLLLGFLGTSGDNTDVVAHVAGFLAGGAIGLLLSLLGPRLARRERGGVLSLVTPLLFALAWALALWR